MAGLRDDLKSMAEGFRWGRRPMVPRSAEPYALERGRPDVPDRLGAHRGGNRCTPGDPEVDDPADAPQRGRAEVYGRDVLEGVRAPLIFYSNHSSHLDATIIMTSLPDRWQSKTAVGAARDYFFDVWWRAGVHRARLRRVPDRSRARRSQRRHEGARAARRRLVARRVPRGHALVRRTRAAVPPRHRAARASRPACGAVPIAIRRRLPGDAQGLELAEGGPAARQRAVSARRSIPRKARRISRSRCG